MIDPKATYSISLKDKSRAAARSFGKNLSTISGKVLNLKTVLVGLAGVGGFGLLLKNSFASGDALAKTSDKIGIATEKLAALHHVTGLYTSVGAPAMNEALTKASKRLGEFNQTGGGAAATWLKELNLDTKELARLSPDQLFQRYSQAVSGLNDRGRQLAAMSALMGDESRALIGVVDAGSEAFRSATEEVNALGIAMNRTDTAKLEAANDAFFRLQGVIKGVANRIAIGLAPWMEALTNYFVDTAKDANGWGQTITGVFNTVAKAAGVVGDMVHGLKIAWKTLAIVIEGAIAAILVPVQGLVNSYIGLRQLLNEGYTPPQGLVFMSDIMKVSGDRIMVLRKELEVLTGSEWPSDKVEEFFLNLQTSATAAGMKVAEARKQIHASTIPPSIEEDPAIIYEQEKNARIEELYNNHLTRIMQADENAIAMNQALWASGMKGRMQVMGGVLNKMSGLMLSSSKTQFKIGKAAAKGQAVVDTYLAATKAYQSLAGIPIIGPALGAAAAAAAILSGKAKLDAINRTQFGGGAVASVGTGGVSIGSVPTGAPAAPTAPSPTDAAATTTKTLNITLIGGNQTSEDIRDTMDLINEELGDGFNLNVTIDQ